MPEVYGDYLYINDEEFVHCKIDFTPETIKNKFQTQSGHSDITVLRKNKLTVNISFINPANGIREERECEFNGLAYSRVEKSERLDYIDNHLGLYDISFSLEEI